MRTFRLLTGAIALSLSPMSWAQDHSQRPDHFKAQPSETLEQAVANLSEYNDKLSSILAKNVLSATDLNEVHRLTYTLETALEKIHTELAASAEVLEEVHLASERADAEGVKAHGATYLEITRTVVK